MDFESKIKTLYNKLEKCSLCPRKCGAKRKEGHSGFCRSADKILIASANLHFGEEPPISGDRGSGTIFFSNCVLSCVFCQNYPISQMGNGREVSLKELIEAMLNLQKKGAHNINLVTPTHYAAHIAKALYEAKNSGLKIPIVYNCGGYEAVETLSLLEGLIDIYLPDMKYADNNLALKYSSVADYVENNRAALKEMKRQTGNLKINSDNIASRGLIIRHLVLPNNLENTKRVLDFIAKEISTGAYISLMAQYHKAYKADNFKELSAPLDKVQYKRAVEYLKFLNLDNGWIQEQD